MEKAKQEVKDIYVNTVTKPYITKPKWRRYSEETKKQAIKLYMEGNSGRAVGRILGISINTCIYWIKKYAKTIKEKKVSK